MDKGQRGIRRINLPLQVIAIVIVNIVCDISVVNASRYYLSRAVENQSVLRGSFAMISGFALTLGIVSIIMIAIICDKMYNMDPLTQVANSDRLVQHLVRLMMMGQLSRYTCVYINLVDFRFTNNRIGKVGGDVCLRTFAVTIKEYLGRKNFIGRLGGDNFIIYVRNDQLDNFLKFVRCIPVQVNVNGHDITVRLMARAGVYPLTNSDTPESALNCSAIAMNFARSSKTEVVWFEEELREKFVHDKQILDDFDKSIFEDEFIVNYQPKVNIKTDKVVGAEALVTWKRNGVIYPPEQFIPVLEQSNKIVELDFYMLKSVCEHIIDWKKQDIEPVPVSINFSKVHFANAMFARRIIDVVKNSGVEPNLIEIELTESNAFEDLEVVKEFINVMHEYGIRVLIDDFGTGYSSLSLIDNIDADCVKLDKSFIRNLDAKKHKTFVTQIISMLKNLDFDVICEGVETEEQAEIVEIAGCEIAQGFLYGHNLSKESFERRLM